MKKYVYISFVLLVGLAACEQGAEPAPDTLIFRLVSATLNGNAIDPVPDYTLTLHFDADGTPTVYEASGTAIAVPTPKVSGDWRVDQGSVLFSADGESREVAVSLEEITTLSNSYELQWSLGKTEIAWEYVGEYTYHMERVE